MNQTEFLARIDSILDSVEAQADAWFENLDLDVETRREGHVLNLVYDNGHQIVINSQAPLQEIWVAARSGAFHYRFDGQNWKDTRAGQDLHDALSRLCSEASGLSLVVTL